MVLGVCFSIDPARHAAIGVSYRSRRGRSTAPVR